MHSRRGSILLLCLVIVGTLSVLVFGFVRMAQLHQESNTEMTRQLLAREAARMGTTHAVEQILRDYITEPFTRMDGPARAPFQTHDYPYLTTGIATTPNGITWDSVNKRYTGNDVNDSSPDRVIYMPLFSEWIEGSYAQASNIFNWQYNRNNEYADGGTVSSDGRGCYIEPNWHNRVTGPSGATPPARIRFGQDMTALAAPDRNQALFLDENWKAVTAATPAEARNKARYRLRYTVSVMDLDGEILMNPDPAMDYRMFTSANPADYNVASRYPDTVRAQHALPAIITSAASHGGEYGGVKSGVTGGVKAEHLFIGRGFTSNFDQRPLDGTAAGDTPRYFPLMFRRTSADGKNFFQYFHNQSGGGEGSSPASPGNRDVAPRLFAMAGGGGVPAVAAAIAGGQPISLPAQNPYGFTLRRSLMGPQYSFVNMDLAMFSNKEDDAWSSYARDGEMRSYGTLTPFGRGVTKGADTRYSGPAATPWAVNILTAPVKVIDGLVYGYVPQGAIQTFTRVGTSTPAYFEDRATRNLFVRQINPAFTYDAPAFEGVQPNYHVERTNPGDAGYQVSTARYPGELGFNGFTSATAWINDSLGTYLRAANNAGLPDFPKTKAYVSADGDVHVTGDGSQFTGAFDPYSATPFVRAAYHWSTPAYQASYPQTGIDDGVRKFSLTHPDSVWRAVVQAMGMAVAIARAQVMEYPTSATMSSYTGSPAKLKLFDGAAWTDVKVQSIADIDQLFLANLGIDIAHPSAVTPPGAGASQSLQAWYGTYSNSGPAGINVAYHSFVPGWNVASLKGLATFDLPATGLDGTTFPHAPYTSTERTACLEMIINDFRLSFFGSNAAYSGFQLLDFNGDGYVTCSALTPLASASAADPLSAYRDIVRARDLCVDHAVVATSVNRADIAASNVFCLTGNFTVSKSHFWRVMTRGEVWDNVFKTVVGQAALDTVLCVDPMDTAKELTPASGDAALGQYATHVMYQRWVFDFNRVSMSRKMW